MRGKRLWLGNKAQPWGGQIETQRHSSGGTSVLSTTTWNVTVRWGSGSSAVPPEEGEMALSWDRGDSNQRFSLLGRSGFRKGCAGRWGSHHSRSCSRGVWTWCWIMRFSGYSGSAWSTIRLGDLKGLFQLWWLHDSRTERNYGEKHLWLGNKGTNTAVIRP